MFHLEELQQLVKKRKRVGRGGSRGGTSGKGHKGQKARSGGYVPPGFEGGQMPLYRRLPKRGFTNARFKQEVITVNLAKIESSYNAGDTVTIESLVQKKVVKVPHGIKNFIIKVLANGTLSKKLHIIADAYSTSAVEAIENVGGKAQIREM